MQFSREEDPPSGFNWNNAWFIAYGVVMIAVLSIGFLGNTMTVIILRKHEHASKSLTPLMINLAIASLIIIVLGYPLVISVVVRGSHVTKEDPTCRWSAFINGTVGGLIVSFAIPRAFSNSWDEFFTLLINVNMSRLLGEKKILSHCYDSDNGLPLGLTITEIILLWLIPEDADNQTTQ